MAVLILKIHHHWGESAATLEAQLVSDETFATLGTKLPLDYVAVRLPDTVELLNAG